MTKTPPFALHGWVALTARTWPTIFMMAFLSCGGKTNTSNPTPHETGAPGSDTADSADTGLDWPDDLIILDNVRVVDAAQITEDAAVLIVGDLIWVGVLVVFFVLFVLSVGMVSVMMIS